MSFFLFIKREYNFLVVFYLSFKNALYFFVDRISHFQIYQMRVKLQAFMFRSLCSRRWYLIWTEVINHLRSGVLWVSLPTTWRLTTWDPEYSGRPVFQTPFKFRRKIKFQISVHRNFVPQTKYSKFYLHKPKPQKIVKKSPVVVTADNNNNNKFWKFKSWKDDKFLLIRK